MMNDGAETFDPNDYTNVTDAQLYGWIRELEYDHMMHPERQQGAQRLIDKYCAELGRRGLD